MRKQRTGSFGILRQRKVHVHQLSNLRRVLQRIAKQRIHNIPGSARKGSRMRTCYNCEHENDNLYCRDVQCQGLYIEPGGYREMPLRGWREKLSDEIKARLKQKDEEIERLNILLKQYENRNTPERKVTNVEISTEEELEKYLEIIAKGKEIRNDGKTNHI